MLIVFASEYKNPKPLAEYNCEYCTLLMPRFWRLKYFLFACTDSHPICGGVYCRHMIDKRGVRRASINLVVGVGTFLCDLALLYGLVRGMHLDPVLATPMAFLVAVTLNHALARRYVFRQTARGLWASLSIFLGLACLGALVSTVAMYILVTWWGVAFLLARILIAGVVGALSYLFHLYINFRVVGQHH